jgi:hypothetical protein
MLQRNRGAIISNPGANAVKTIYDDKDEAPFSDADKLLLRLTLLTDQSVVINNYWAESATATLRLVSTSSQWTSHGAMDAPVASSHSTQPITAVSKANLVNNDYFTVTYTTVIDGVTTPLAIVFEYKVVGAGFVATQGRTTIDVTGATDATSVAVITAAAVVSAFAGALTAATPSSAVLTLTVAACSARLTVAATENVANAGFTIGTATTGTESVFDKNIRLRPGRNKLTVVTTTAPTDWSCAVETVNGEVKDY